MHNTHLALLSFGVGVLLISGAIGDWNWVFHSRKGRVLVSLVGRQGARLYYGTLGIILCACGIGVPIGRMARLESLFPQSTMGGSQAKGSNSNSLVTPLPASPHAISLSEYVQRAESDLRTFEAQTQKVVDLLRSVQNDRDVFSAQTQLSGLHIEAPPRLSSGPPQVHLAAGEGDKFEQERQRINEAFRTAGKNAATSLGPEVERIAQMSSLGRNLSSKALETIQDYLREIERQHGGTVLLTEDVSPETHITITLRNAPDSDLRALWFAKLKEAYPYARTAYGHGDAGVQVIYMAPVVDVGALAKKIQYATVSHVDTQRNVIDLTFDAEAIAKLSSELAAQKAQERDAVQAKYDNAIKEALACGHKITKRTASIRTAERLYEARNELASSLGEWNRLCESCDKGLTEAQDEFRDALTQQWHDERTAIETTMKSEWARLCAEPRILVEVVELAHASNTELPGTDQITGFGEALGAAGHKDNPYYLVANLNQLDFYDHFSSHDAIKRLSHYDPRTVKDKELRKVIARTLRDKLLNKRLEYGHGTPIFKALAVWGGKYSVPILAEMLQDKTSFVDVAEVMSALALVKTPEAAQAIVPFLSDFHQREHAITAIRRLGTVSEDSLIGYAPIADAAGSFVAIRLLGETGTRKSTDLLRQASRSRNPMIKQAAIQSLKSVMLRHPEPKPQALVP